MVLFCVEIIVVTATVDVVQWYSFVCVEIIVVTAKVDIEKGTVFYVEFIVFRATVDTVQWYCVVCGVYCGYSNSRYSAMVTDCVWRYLWL